MVGEIIKFTLPALIVFLTAFYSIRLLLKKDQENQRVNIILQNQKIITPLRLQAYERIMLFLERINPNSVIMRLQTPNMTVQQLQKEMLMIIRTEYEHNLSQQVYLSIEAWEEVKIAKEKTIKMINTLAEELKSDDNAIRLSQLIFEELIESEQSPTQAAINKIKEEIRILF
jgi:hypothetical protein